MTHTATVETALANLRDTLAKHGDRNPDPEGGSVSQLTIAARALLDALDTPEPEQEFPTCGRCGAENVEDAGDHADQTGHWPPAPADVLVPGPNGTTGRMTPAMLDLANAAYGGHGPMAAPVEDLGAEARRLIIATE